MFVLTLERALFRLSAKTPLFAPLFQLPPRIGSRFNVHPLYRRRRQLLLPIRQPFAQFRH